MDFRCALFDLDGTLLDSMLYWRHIAADTLRRNGYEISEELEKSFIRTPTRVSFEKLKEMLNVKPDIQLTQDDYLRILVPAYKSTANEKPHATEFLEYLSKNGVICGLATASFREAFTYAIERFGWSKYFTEILTTTEAGRNKNDSGLFDVLLNKLGVKKSETVIFEDALYSIEAAVNNGYRVIAMRDETALNDEAKIRELSEKYISDYKELF